MNLNKAVAKKSNTVDAYQNRNRALSLLLEEMAEWYPAPYYDVEAMVAEETKGFKLSRQSKTNLSDLQAKCSKNRKPLGALNSASPCVI